MQTYGRVREMQGQDESKQIPRIKRGNSFAPLHLPYASHEASGMPWRGCQGFT